MSQDTLLELENVVVTYGKKNSKHGFIKALDGVSLKLERGRILGLAGPNGAGKTTLIEVCIGAQKFDSGTVRWFNNTQLHPVDRKRIGFAPDVPEFPARLTAREVLHFLAALDSISHKQASSEIERLASQLQVEDVLDRRIETLSRGNSQRIGLIQAAMSKRDVLICDESFAPLDPVAQINVRELLVAEAQRGAAVLISSHQLDQLPKFASDIAIMTKGRVVRSINCQEYQSNSDNNTAAIEDLFIAAISEVPQPFNLDSSSY